MAVFFAVYIFSGKLGLSLAFVNTSTSAVWPPTGIALVAVLAFGYRFLPAVFVGSFLVNNFTHCPWMISLGIASGDTLEALVAVTLVRRFADGLNCFEQAKTTFLYILFGPVFSTLFSATFGVISLGLLNGGEWHQCWNVWSTWWIGNMTSDLVIAPALMIWLFRRLPRLPTIRLLEAVVLLFTLVLVGRFVFIGQGPYSAMEQLEYMSFPPLLWGIFRFGQRGATSSVLIISGFAIWGTLNRMGPFTVSDKNESLLIMQSFTGIISVAGLTLAAVILEREKLQLRLQIKDNISQIIASSHGLVEAVPKIMRVICEQAGWDFGAVWEVSNTKNRISCVEVWSSADLNAQEFETATRNKQFEPGIGLPGRVWLSGIPVWIADVTTDDNFPRAPQALKAGLKSAICFPLKFGDEILGLIECFKRNRSEPDRAFFNMLEPLGVQIGQFIERKRAEVNFLEISQLYQQIISDAKEGIIVNGPDLRHLVWNPFMEGLTGLPAAEVIGKHPEEVFSFLLDTGIINQMNRALMGETIPQVEFSFHVPQSGRSGWATNSSGPLRNNKGEIIGIISIVADITRRKQTEEKLKEAHMMLTSMCEGSTDAIFIKDFQGRYLLVNRVASEIMGKKTEEIIGKDDGFLFSAPEAKQFRETDRKVMESGQVISYEEDVFTASGVVTFLTTKGPIYNAEGRASGLFGVSRDITERKQAERALRESEASLRMINEQLPAVIWTVDPDLRISSVSGASTGNTGTRYGHIVGRTLYDIYKTTDENYPGLVAHRRALNGEKNSVELQFETRCWRCNIEPLVDSGGNIIGCIGVAMDISKAKETENRLRELAAIVEGSEEAIVSLAVDGTVISWNKGAEQVFGFAAQEMIGQSVYVIFPQGDRGNAEKTIASVLQGNPVEPYETIRLRKDGTLCEVSVKVSPVINPAGSIVGISAIYRDISERKKLEKQVLKISAEERRRIGHELHDGLGQHLAGIAFKIKSLEETLACRLPQLAKETRLILDLVNEGIRQTRDLARGMDPVDLEVAGLPAALQTLAAQTSEHFYTACKFSCNQGSLAVDKSIGLAMYRIAQESIRNAINHGKAKHISMDLVIGQTQICLTIRDDGGGFHLEDSHKSGMGLRIMRYRAGAVGATLTIQSQINIGTDVVCVVAK